MDYFCKTLCEVKCYLRLELIFFSAIYIELQKAKDEEKHMNSLQVSFERQLQNERTLKIQVCVCAPTQVWKVWNAFYSLYFLQMTLLSHYF